MTFGFALLTIGSLLAYSGYSNQSVGDVLKGLTTKRGGGPGETGFISLTQGLVGGAVPRTGGEGPPAGPGLNRLPGGITTFDGKPVCKWVAEELQWARDHGWTGGMESGFRSKQKQREVCSTGVQPCATPGKSNHQGKRYPKCAADVTEPQQLDEVLSKKPGRKLHWTGKSIGDEPHFSSGLVGV